MNFKYDIDVDYNTLLNIEEMLRSINSNLGDSTKNMITALQKSQGFLAGNQFEKARRITFECNYITSRAANNINNGIEYIVCLRELVAEYGDLRYEGIGE